MQKCQGFVENGNLTITVGGVSAAQKAQGSYPQAQVTVYLAGTLVLATIYSDNASTPKPNPFTAATNGYFFFYAANARYDVTFSGGGLAAPLTFGDILLADPSSFTGTVTSFTGNQGSTRQNAVVALTGDYALRMISNVPFLSSADYNFSALTPGGSLVLGANTITLSPMPLGISADSIGIAQLYISGGSGFAEVVPITGFTATTVTVTCANTHSGAWTIQSATSGIQEAVIATAGYGQVRVPSGIISIKGLAAGAATLTGCVTVPGSYNLSLRGAGKGVTDIRCDGLTGDRIYFQAGSGFYVDVGDFTIRDTSAIMHTAGAMVRIQKKISGGSVSNIEVENGLYGIEMVSCQNVPMFGCIVGAQQYPYYITSLGVDIPGGGMSAYDITNCRGSSVGAISSAFRLEGPITGSTMTGCSAGAVSPGVNNQAIQIVFSSALGGQELNFEGCIFDAGGVGVGIQGDGATYPTGFYIFSGCECAGHEYGLFIDGKVANVHWTGGLIKGGGGATNQGVFLRSANNIQIAQANIECNGTAALTADTTVDVLIDAVVVGRNSTSPTNGISFGGACTGFVVQNSNFSTVSSPSITNPAVAAHPIRLSNNVGIDDVIPAVASAATLILPINPNFTLTGNTTITAVTSYLVAGSRGTLISGSTLFILAGGSIGRTVLLSPNVPYSWHWDGTLWWVQGQYTVVPSAAATNSTSSIGSTVLLTGPTVGVYRVSWALNTGNVSGGSATALVTIGWTDVIGAKTSAGAALTLAAAANQSGTILINIASGNLTYSTTYVAGTGGNYNLQLTAELVKG